MRWANARTSSTEKKILWAFSLVFSSVMVGRRKMSSLNSAHRGLTLLNWNGGVRWTSAGRIWPVVSEFFPDLLFGTWH